MQMVCILAHGPPIVHLDAMPVRAMGDQDPHASGKTRLGGRPTLTRGLHKSGKKMYVEMSFAMVVDDAGSALGSVAVARDVTERVEREKAAAVGTARA